MKTIRRDSWPAGINNIAQPDRLPDGAVRDLLNLDPSEGGTLDRRAGFEKVLECSAGRAAFDVGRSIVVVDGPDLLGYSTLTGDVTALGQLSGNVGEVAGATLNGQLYIATLAEQLRTDGYVRKPWTVAEPGFSVELIGTGSLGGLHRIALTATGADGEESSAHSESIQVPPGAGLRITTTDTRPLRVYASAPNSTTLYYQGLLIGGALAITNINDATEQLTTDGLAPMAACVEYVAYHGVLIGRLDNCLFVSLPMCPHLMDPIAGFFQYAGTIKALAATDGGVFVVADKTYFLTGIETREPLQRVVLDIDAVEGSAVALPDGRAAWFTRYGQAIGSPDGTVELPNRKTFAPDVAAYGAAGLVEHNGNPMVVTTMRGITKANHLAAGDFADLETE